MRFLAVFFLWLLAASSAFAQFQSKPHLEVKLMAEARTAPAGETVWLMLDYRHEKGWHTYYLNPGESGLPAQFEWDTDGAYTVGDVVWPSPETLNLLGLISYGYGDDTRLLVPVTLPKNVATGATIPLKANVKFLVCADICVPESHKVATDIKIGPLDLTNKAAFDAARKQMPKDGVVSGQIEMTQTGYRIGFRGAPKTAQTAYFYPETEGLISPPAPQPIDLGKGGFSLNVTKGDALLPPEGLAGILRINDQAFYVRLKTQAVASDLYGQGAPKPEIGLLSLGLAALMALIGGMILNLMPCVFPVLSMKLMALARSGESASETKREALFYGAGAIVSFVVLALLIELIRAGGAAIGWGFQLQSPWVTGALMVIMLLVALNMAGVFNGFAPLTRLGQLSVLQSKPDLSAFLTGVLAVVVAAPCTAPFMASAVGIALSQGGLISLVIFVALGVGFALPFVGLIYLVADNPNIAAKLPKPGAWMERLKIGLSIPMFLAALWLGGVFWQQITPKPATTAEVTAVSSVPYDAARLEALRAEGKPVFIDMTAAWCVSCKVNERLVLHQKSVQEAFKAKGVVYMVGDWTNADPAISAYLDGFQRSGVPLYVYYPPNGQPVVLPQLLDKGKIIAMVNE